MTRLRTKRDKQFWDIVEDLHWRLDDGSGDGPPSEPDRGTGGGGGGGKGAWPRWASHLIAFLFGGITWGALLIAPPVAPVVALVGLVTFVAVAVRRRWR
jgi:hypothetical protein